jgi:hypothetical protein
MGARPSRYPSELNDNVDESWTTNVMRSGPTRANVSRTCGAKMASGVTWGLEKNRYPPSNSADDMASESSSPACSPSFLPIPVSALDVADLPNLRPRTPAQFHPARSARGIAGVVGRGTRSLGPGEGLRQTLQATGNQNDSSLRTSPHQQDPANAPRGSTTPPHTPYPRLTS